MEYNKNNITVQCIHVCDLNKSYVIISTCTCSYMYVIALTLAILTCHYRAIINWLHVSFTQLS